MTSPRYRTYLKTIEAEVVNWAEATELNITN